MIEFNWTLPSILNLLVAVILPVIVGLVTDRLTESWKKVILLMSLAAVSGFIAQWVVVIQDGGTFDIGDAAAQALVNLGVAILVRFGLLRSTIEPRIQANNVIRLFGPAKNVDVRTRHAA